MNKTCLGSHPHIKQYFFRPFFIIKVCVSRYICLHCNLYDVFLQNSHCTVYTIMLVYKNFMNKKSIFIKLKPNARVCVRRTYAVILHIYAPQSTFTYRSDTVKAPHHTYTHIYTLLINSQYQ